MSDAADDLSDVDVKLWVKPATRGDLARFALKQQRLTLTALRYAIAFDEGDEAKVREMFQSFLTLEDEVSKMIKDYVSPQGNDG